MPSAATARPPDNSIGLLRLLLAGAVLWGHSWYLAGRSAEEPISRWLLGGGEAVATFAVKAFFVLSGYLVMQSEQRLASTRRFLWHRLLRIYPGFWASLFVTAILLPALIWSLQSNATTAWADAFGYVRANWLLFYEITRIDHLFVMSAPLDDLDGALWTLPYEVGCYAVLAFFGWLGLLRTRSLSLWILGSAWLLLYAHDILRPASAWFFKSEGRLLGAWFLTGALAANLPAAQLRRWLDWRGALAATLAYLAACRFGGLALVGPLAITALVLSLAWLVPIRDFEARVGGDYSYGIYIYAYPVQQCLLSAGVLRYGMASYLALVVVITVLLAFASWHLVEKRALAWKSLGRAPLKPVPSASLAPQAA